VTYHPEAEKDLKKLDNSRRILALKAIKKVSTNPLPKQRGGYGTPLGSKQGNNLTGFYKIKLRGIGIRVVYRIVETKGEMNVIVVGIREDNEVYKLAYKRIE